MPELVENSSKCLSWWKILLSARAGGKCLAQGLVSKGRLGARGKSVLQHLQAMLTQDRRVTGECSNLSPLNRLANTLFQDRIN